MGYGTLLHSAHANSSNMRRTCLTMWYYPAFPDLPERTQATIAQVESNTKLSDNASSELVDLLSPLVISYSGDAEPIETNMAPRVL